MIKIFSELMFWALLSVSIPLFYKAYYSKSKSLASALRFLFIALQVIVLALVFMPWTTIAGVSYSGFRLASEFSYQAIYVFMLIVLMTIILLIINRPEILWLVLIFNIFATILLFYMMFRLSVMTGTNMAGWAAIAEAFLLMTGNVVAVLTGRRQ